MLAKAHSLVMSDNLAGFGMLCMKRVVFANTEAESKKEDPISWG